MEDYLQIKQETVYQIHEDLGKRKVCAKLVCYSLKDKRSTVSQLVNTSSRPVRPNHTSSIASLQETNRGCFSTNLKQNLIAWSGEQNRHKSPESFTCKGSELKQC
jgi:hypothetical protein